MAATRMKLIKLWEAAVERGEPKAVHIDWRSLKALQSDQEAFYSDGMTAGTWRNLPFKMVQAPLFAAAITFEEAYEVKADTVIRVEQIISIEIIDATTGRTVYLNDPDNHELFR